MLAFMTMSFRDVQYVLKSAPEGGKVSRTDLPAVMKAASKGDGAWMESQGGNAIGKAVVRVSVTKTVRRRLVVDMAMWCAVCGRCGLG